LTKIKKFCAYKIKNKKMNHFVNVSQYYILVNFIFKTKALRRSYYLNAKSSFKTIPITRIKLVQIPLILSSCWIILNKIKSLDLWVGIKVQVIYIILILFTVVISLIGIIVYFVKKEEKYYRSYERF